MDMEILAPAGSPEILKGVINAGADAVYVGGNKFGARAYASNFTDEDLLWAIDYVHLFGKKLYLTVNTLLKNKELENELYEYILPLYQAGLDAVLVQDYGVLSYLHDHFPDLPLHSSTQMTVSSKESAAYLKSLGVERVVLSRELSLKEMKEIHDEVGVELEAFVHGALCYCYSGMCLYSSVLGGRSGNRGRCAQPCRLAYDVIDENNTINKDTYILSLKDHCAIEEINQLKEAGIYSLKIEGRMKQAEYACGVTGIYAKALKDGATGDLKKQLKAFGNRGGFTNSYLYKNNDSNMVTYEDPSLHKASTLPEADCSEKKLVIDGFLNLFKGTKASFTLTYGDLCVSVEGNLVEEAKSKPISYDDVKGRMNKTGNTCFTFDSLEINMDEDIFVPNGALNSLRRDALELLKEELLKKYRRNSQKEKNIGIKENWNKNNCNPKTNTYIAEITKRSQLDSVIDSDIITDIYLNATIYSRNNFCNELSADIEKIHSYKKACYLKLPMIIRNKDVTFFEGIANACKNLYLKGVVVANTDSFALVKRIFGELDIIGDYSLYSFNNRAVSFLIQEGCMRLTAPLELNKAELMHRDNSTSEFIIYGKYPLMHTANCVCKNSKGCSKNPQNLYLKDRYNANFLVQNNCSFCYNTIYNSLPTNLLDKKEELVSMDFHAFRFIFTDEKEAEIKNILSSYRRNLNYNNNQKYTNGHYNRGVE